jgi:hypothetical protein
MPSGIKIQLGTLLGIDYGCGGNSIYDGIRWMSRWIKENWFGEIE